MKKALKWTWRNSPSITVTVLMLLGTILGILGKAGFAALYVVVALALYVVLVRTKLNR